MRCQLAVFASYRIDQYSDPEGFKNALGAVLEGFPDETIKYVCDPRTGMQRRLKWPPTVSEVVDACEEHGEHLARMRAVRREHIVRPYEKPRAKPLWVFVAQDHPQYAALEQWTKSAADGEWETYQAPDNRRGIRVEPTVLVKLGLMKRNVA